MTQPANTTSIEKATGLSWDVWVGRLDALEADQLTHTDIAKEVQAILKPLDLDINKGWWAQNVTVAYEQHIGRRQPGQRNDGTYEVSVNKTIPQSSAQTMDAWIKSVQNLTEFNGVKFVGTPRISNTDKWLNWRVDLADGSKVHVACPAGTASRTQLTITHTKLSSEADKESWRSYWKTYLNSINY